MARFEPNMELADVKHSIALAMLVLAVSAPVAHAQRAAPAAVSGARAFLIEAVGGTVGSAVGIVVGLSIARPDDCPSEDDVACVLRRLGVAGIGSVTGAAIGTIVAGRWAGTRPSALGAFLGAAAGAAAGIGLEHLITEELGQPLSNVGAVLLFSLTQGVLAAAGSRLVARASGR